MLRNDFEKLLKKRKCKGDDCPIYKFWQDIKNGSMVLTIPEVAKELRISRRSVYRIISEGKLRAIKIKPDILRVAVRDLIEFQKKSKTK